MRDGRITEDNRDREGTLFVVPIRKRKVVAIRDSILAGAGWIGGLPAAAGRGRCQNRDPGIRRLVCHPCPW